MNSIQYKFKPRAFLTISALLILSACNKEPEQFVEPAQVPSTGSTLGETLATSPNDSLYYRLIVQGGMLPAINNKATTFTMFVPDNNAMKIFINAISGGLVPLPAPDAVFSGFITANITIPTADAILSYNIMANRELYS